MRILEWHIDRFGGLTDRHFSPATGFNLIRGDNESGKSTTMSFIRSLFYGLAGNARNLEENDRKRLMPWGESNMGGYLVFEWNGCRYRIERTFGLSRRFDRTVLRDETTGQPIDVPSSRSIGEFLFDVGEQTFVNTVFIGQLASSDLSADSGTLAKLTNLATTGDELVSCSEIDARLRKAMVRLKAERGSGGLINAQLALKDTLLAERNQVVALEAERSGMILQYRRLDQDRQQTRGDLSRARSLLTACKDWQDNLRAEESARLRRDLDRLEDLEKDEINFQENRQADILRLSSHTEERIRLTDERQTVVHAIADLEDSLETLEQKRAAVSQLSEKRQLIEESLHNVHTEMGFVEQESIEDLNAHQAAFDLQSQALGRAGDSAKEKKRYRRSMLFVLLGSFLLAASGIAAGLLVDRAAYMLVPLGIFAAIAFGLRLRQARLNRTRLLMMEKVALSQLLETSRRTMEESRSRRKDQLARLEQQEARLADHLEASSQALASAKDAFAHQLSVTMRMARALVREAGLPQDGLTGASGPSNPDTLAGPLIGAARDHISLVDEHLAQVEDEQSRVLSQSGFPSQEALEQALADSRDRLQTIRLELAEKRSALQSLLGGLSPEQLAGHGAEARARLLSAFPDVRTDLSEALHAFRTGHPMPDEPINHVGPLSRPDAVMSHIPWLSAFIESARSLLAEQDTACARLESDLNHRFAGLRSLSDIDSDLKDVRERLSRMEADHDALMLARQTLDKAFQSLQQSFGPRLNQRAGEILAMLTGQRYQSMRADRFLAVFVEDPRTGTLQESDYFSGGTIDQIHLALRLSVAELTAPNPGRLPLFLDDIFVQYDDRRARAGLDFLRRYAKEQDLQVLLFTCHDRMAHLAGIDPARMDG